MATLAEARAFLIEGVDDFLSSEVVPDLNTIDLTDDGSGEIGDGSFQELHIAFAKYCAVDVNDGPSIRGQGYKQVRWLFTQVQAANDIVNKSFVQADKLTKNTPEWSACMDDATEATDKYNDYMEQIRTQLEVIFMGQWDPDTQTYKV